MRSPTQGNGIIEVSGWSSGDPWLIKKLTVLRAIITLLSIVYMAFALYHTMCLRRTRGEINLFSSQYILGEARPAEQRQMLYDVVVFRPMFHHSIFRKYR